MVTETRKAVVRALLKLEESGTAEGDFWGQELLGKERGLGQFLLFGVLREMGRLDKVLNLHSKKTMKEQEPVIRIILRLGAFELKFSRAPVHACIDQAVRLTKFHELPFAAGFVNAVLRNVHKSEISDDKSVNVPRFIRTRAKSRLSSEKFSRWSHWIGEPAPITIVTKDGSPPPFAARLCAWDFEQPLYIAEEEGHPSTWPEYEDGTWWVMSPSSAMVVELLAKQVPKKDRSGLQVLDACAAPGSKSLRLHQYGFSVLACDRSKKRLRTFASNCDRMGFDIPSHRVNWLGNNTVQDSFDIVLLDAPCSGLGVLRRHPEIRWRRTEQDITVNAIVQKQLIDVLYPMVKKGGLLVYSVCSFFEEERGQFPEDSRCLLSWETPLESGEDAFFITIHKKRRTDDRATSTRE